MRLFRRPLAPGELDLELVVLAVSVGSFGLLASWLAVGLPWPHCLFLSLTGYPCATCGATRGAIQLVQGHFVQAWLWNPLMFVLYLGIGLFDLYAVAALALRTRRIRVGFSAAEKSALRWIVLLLLAANWGYLLLHARRYG